MVYVDIVVGFEYYYGKRVIGNYVIDNEFGKDIKIELDVSDILNDVNWN